MCLREWAVVVERNIGSMHGSPPPRHCLGLPSAVGASSTISKGQYVSSLPITLLLPPPHSLSTNRYSFRYSSPQFSDVILLRFFHLPLFFHKLHHCLKCSLLYVIYLGALCLQSIFL
ncbi:hypothetical protein E2C01_026213 [Portunus trituberculatus]|uniref:Uncharacterized protein n=1 Tax=Portunus trituberculatus TaxID=210409 RepID=A0A5B7EEV5_PORTR|nr:hypothetical protein [Portunus trituberculatus]